MIISEKEEVIEVSVAEIKKGKAAIPSYVVSKAIERGKKLKILWNKQHMELDPYEEDPYSVWSPPGQEKEETHCIYLWKPQDIASKVMGYSWANRLGDELNTEYMVKLSNFVKKRRAKANVRPSQKEVFNAFKHTHYEDTKVVIIGQDPYPSSMANGLAFSSKFKNTYPESLKKIIEAVEIDTAKGIYVRKDARLFDWAHQGVLLLNMRLTVEDRKPGAHAEKGWEEFIKRVITELNEKEFVIYCLWGMEAKRAKDWIKPIRHIVLEASHPASAVRNNMRWDCNHFHIVNYYLKEKNLTPIKW